MHKPPFLIGIVACCIILILTGFLDWVDHPSYSLFTIADYAASYGRYMTSLRLLAICAFTLPLGSSLVLVSLPHESTSRIIGIIVGAYGFVFSCGVVILLTRIKGSLPSPIASPGAYITLVASAMLCTLSICAREKRTHVRRDTRDSRVG